MLNEKHLERYEAAKVAITRVSTSISVTIGTSNDKLSASQCMKQLTTTYFTNLFANRRLSKVSMRYFHKILTE